MEHKGFNSPNFTQSPNDWFDDMLPSMGKAELKVTAILIRHTFGFHRTRVEMGLARLAILTGLSEKNVLVGAKQAEARGIVKRLNAGHGDRKRTVWELVITTSAREVVIETASLGEVALPPLGRQTTSPTEGREIKGKKNIKKGVNTEGEVLPAPPAPAPAVKLYREVSGREEHASQAEAITEQVGTDPKALSFWREVVSAYCLIGWNPGNVAAMLEYFERHDLPTSKRRKPSQEKTHAATNERSGQSDPRLSHAQLIARRLSSKQR